MFLSSYVFSRRIMPNFLRLHNFLRINYVLFFLDFLIEMLQWVGERFGLKPSLGVVVYFVAPWVEALVV